MQKRHSNRQQYFSELAATSEKYIIPYISKHHPVENGMSIIELGCGDGGNLLPFAQRGCKVTGLDISAGRINDAQNFFEKHNAKGRFIAADILQMAKPEDIYDIVICHDVMEHIENKQQLLSAISMLLKTDGMAFIAFPAWQMPFDGHQQICHSYILSHTPWVHLLPTIIYRSLLQYFGESKACINELLSIKRTRTSIESFERMVSKSNLRIQQRDLWFVNPHYKTKFELTPRRLSPILAHIPYIRNYFTTSCFYLLATSACELSHK